MYKSMILKDGVGVVGLIFFFCIGYSFDYKFLVGFSIKGVEYEVGIEFVRDIVLDENLDEELFDEVVFYYFFGIEVVGI